MRLFDEPEARRRRPRRWRRGRRLFQPRSSPGVGHGARYKFVLDGRELPDPYARFLPDGVHGAARRSWHPDYRFRQRAPGAAPARRAGHLRAARRHLHRAKAPTPRPGRRLPYLAELGVTTLELMPLSSFPGARGWGYDGVAHYRALRPLRQPDSLRRFVDEAHGLGLRVLLDVVYNHFGPAGNYLARVQPALLHHASLTTPWGEAPRFSRSADAALRDRQRASTG